MKRLVSCSKLSAFAVTMVALLTAGLAAPAQAGSGIVVNGTLSISGTGAMVMAQYAVPPTNMSGIGQNLLGFKLIVNSTTNLSVAESLAYGTYNGSTYVPGSITQYIEEGRNGGSWTGTIGLTDPAAAYDQTLPGEGHQELTTVAAVVNGDLAASPTDPVIYTSFGGFGGSYLTDNSILVAETYVGDTQLKGYVDQDDYDNFMYGYTHDSKSPTGGPAGWAYGDFNGDGVVDMADYNLLMFGMANQGAPIAMETPDSLPVPVPEPGSLALMFAAAIALAGCGLRRRGRAS